MITLIITSIYLAYLICNYDIYIILYYLIITIYLFIFL